jgi:hypothetical protein
MTRKPWLSECANARPDPKIDSAAWTRQSMPSDFVDCHVADAPRNDGVKAVIASPAVIASEARQSMSPEPVIASPSTSSRQAEARQPNV